MLLFLLGCARTPAPTTPVITTGCVDGAVPADRLQASVRRGVAWLADFVEDDENREFLAIDGVILFHELAATSADPWVREHSAPLARQLWQERAEKLLSGPPAHTLDAVEGLQMAAIGAELGADPGPMLDWAGAGLGGTDAASVCDLPSGDIDDLDVDGQYALLICAYDLARARARWPERVPDAAPMLPIHVDLLAEWRVFRTGAPDTGRAFLATHHALVLNDYGRLALSEDQAPALVGWLRGTFDSVLATGDVELVAEYIDVFQSLGRTPEDDPMLRAGMCHLLAEQQPDGSWIGPLPPEDPYDTMHPTWTAVVGLRARTFLEDTPYAAYLRDVLGM